jgi:hypothetical protein
MIVFREKMTNEKTDKNKNGTKPKEKMRMSNQ